VAGRCDAQDRLAELLAFSMTERCALRADWPAMESNHLPVQLLAFALDEHFALLARWLVIVLNHFPETKRDCDDPSSSSGFFISS
jgi:hypothetical protein